MPPPSKPTRATSGAASPRRASAHKRPLRPQRVNNPLEFLKSPGAASLIQRAIVAGRAPSQPPPSPSPVQSGGEEFFSAEDAPTAPKPQRDPRRASRSATAVPAAPASSASTAAVPKPSKTGPAYEPTLKVARVVSPPRLPTPAWAKMPPTPAPRSPPSKASPASPPVPAPRTPPRSSALSMPSLEEMDVVVTSPVTSYAAAAATNPSRRSPPASPAPHTSQLPSATCAPAKVPQSPPTKLPPRPRYPPLIVEHLPDWAFHFKELKKRMGHAPNARPFGKGVRFMPREEDEYRAVQRYLTQLEKEAGISWFSYSLPAERSLKVAIRGLPADTKPSDIEDELRILGFLPEYVRPIRARQGRPGCIFFAQLQRNAETIPAIYEVSELLCMPGITIEAWRGKKGPAQCHRCQQFRHSSHNCHRRPACVRCGEEHFARECPRPLEEPATCANCKGSHTANNVSCPVFRKEMRNKKAGTVLLTAAPSRPPKAATTPAAETMPTSLMAEANAPTERTDKPKRRRRRGRKAKGSPPVEQPQPQAEQPALKPRPTAVGGKPKPAPRKATPPQQPEPQRPEQAKDATKTGRMNVQPVIDLLVEILVAYQADQDIVPIVLRGMASLLPNSV